jgi:DNA-binding beta-propeller fold protein YncE
MAIFITLNSIAMGLPLFSMNPLQTKLQSVIQKFEGNGTFVTKWGSKGTTDGTMQKPEDLAINSMTGDVYVTDTKNSRIQKFSEVR